MLGHLAGDDSAPHRGSGQGRGAGNSEVEGNNETFLAPELTHDEPMSPGVIVPCRSRSRASDQLFSHQIPPIADLSSLSLYMK